MRSRARYMSADARCRQLQRLIEASPGLTIEQLAEVAGVAQRSARAYVCRLEREARIRTVLDEPATPRGCTKRLYPFEAAPGSIKKAA